MFTIPENARSPFADHPRKGSGTAMPCVICGVPSPNPRYSVHLHGGGSVLITESEVEEATAKYPGGNMDFYPIGPSCVKKYPELKAGGYLHDSKPKRKKS